MSARVMCNGGIPRSTPGPKHSVTSRGWMDCGAMARDVQQGVVGRLDARKEVLQVCVSKARTCGGRVAETDGEHVAACPVMLFVDRDAKGFCRLERRDLRRRDGDGLPGSGIASLTRGAAAD